MPGRIAAIGPGTGRALVEQGARPALVARDSRGEGLAAALGEQVREGQRALLVRPERARQVVPEALRGLGVEVDAVACYRTVAAPGSHEVAAQVLRGAYDLVVFTSPSTFLHLVTSAGPEEREAILSALCGMKIVAIGEITAGSIRKAGLRVGAVAGRPSEDGIVQAVLEVAAG
jgi:uroporphyrinogen III methyltransferase/synthase